MDALTIIILIGHLLLGVVFCFFGNKWIKVILAIYGFVAGFMLGSSLLPVVTSLDGTALILVSVGIGAVGALLCVLLFYIGLFFLGFGGGLLLCLLAASVLGLNILVWYIYIPVLIICSVLGSLTLNHRRIFVSVFTAFIGASALAQFVHQIIGGIDPDTVLLSNEHAIYSAYSSAIFLVTMAVTFIAGLIVQLTITSKRRKA